MNKRDIAAGRLAAFAVASLMPAAAVSGAGWRMVAHANFVQIG